MSSPAAVHRSPAQAAPRRHHSWWIVGAHWSTVLAVVLAAVSAIWRDQTEHDVLRAQLMVVHQQAGLFVLIALAVRLLARLRGGIMRHEHVEHPLVRLAATLAHIALYGVLLGLPLLGVAVCQASAMKLSVFGLVPVPVVMGDDPDLAAMLADNHVLAAWAMLGLLCAHIGAVVWHHFIRRDRVLLAMLPVQALEHGEGQAVDMPAPASLASLRTGG